MNRLNRRHDRRRPLPTGARGRSLALALLLSGPLALATVAGAEGPALAVNHVVTTQDEEARALSTQDEAPSGIPATPRHAWPIERPHFVFANHYGLSFGLDTIPSGDVALFFGRALPALTPSRAHRRWALGYQVTIAAGGADRYHSSFLTHRHHLMAVSYGVWRPRLYAAFGGGLAVFSGWGRPLPPRGWRPAVAEIEGRIGYLFGPRLTSRRLVGVVGASGRLGWNAASREKAPAPQLGAFIGFLIR